MPKSLLVQVERASRELVVRALLPTGEEIEILDGDLIDYPDRNRLELTLRCRRPAAPAPSAKRKKGST